MADRFAFGINNNRTQCHSRTAKIGGIGPGKKAAKGNADCCKPCDNQPAQRRFHIFLFDIMRPFRLNRAKSGQRLVVG